ncbi:MAG TPA: sugar transferase [Actinomycetes bacterium]|nr:sugar transferase [Actinomycetes bacterium]
MNAQRAPVEQARLRNAGAGRPGEPPNDQVARSALEYQASDSALTRLSSRPEITGFSRRFIRLGASPYLFVFDAIALTVASAGTATGWRGDLFFAVSGLIALASFGLYHGKLHRSVLDDLPSLCAATFLAASASVLATLPTDMALDLAALVRALLLGVVCLTVGRALAYQLIRFGRVRGRLRHRTIVLGAGQVGVHLVEAMKADARYGLDPVGFLDESPTAEPHDLPAPLLGSWTDLERTVRDLRIKRVVVAFATLRESRLVDVLRACERLHCAIYYVPRLFELHHMTHEIDEVHGIPLIQVKRPTFTSFGWYLKRLFDVVMSAVLLVLALPVLVACAVVVAIEGGPGVIFRQQRIGRDGHEFQMLKFRSLRPHSDADSATTWTVKDDPRMGPVGRFLRRTSLDELPQLWNVLRGDMSLVGPRPERPHFASQFGSQVPSYSHRHRVPVGITGWAQINGLRGDTSIDERARFDNYYIENWSLWLDIKILLRTCVQVLGARGQ